jgi:hypothetical protein
MAVSRFFCFPIQMNFAENKKWPTSARWQGGVVDGVVGYMRRGSKPKGTPGSWVVRKFTCALTVVSGAPYDQPDSCTISCRLPLSVSLDRCGLRASPSLGPSGLSTLHETGCSGFTAYWGKHSDSGRLVLHTAHWLGSVGDWPLATAVTHRATGGNHGQRTPKWLKLPAESSSLGA